MARQKVRLTISLDQDVKEAIDDLAESQRVSVSALINVGMAERVGLIPRDMKDENEND